MCENIKCISRDGVNDRQAVNFVFDEGVHCVKQAATQRHTQMANYKKHRGNLLSCTQKKCVKKKNEVNKNRKEFCSTH